MAGGAGVGAGGRAGNRRRAGWELSEGGGRVKRPRTLRIDSQDYDLTDASPETLAEVERLRFIEVELMRLQNMTALLTRARNAYIADLKREVVRERTGYDLGDLLADDD